MSKLLLTICQINNFRLIFTRRNQGLLASRKCKAKYTLFYTGFSPDAPWALTFDDRQAIQPEARAGQSSAGIRTAGKEGGSNNGDELGTGQAEDATRCPGQVPADIDGSSSGLPSPGSPSMIGRQSSRKPEPDNHQAAGIRTSGQRRRKQQRR